MPIPTEFKPFFASLVEKSKKLEVNWEATNRPDAFRVRFPDFSIHVSQEGSKPVVHIRLLNDNGDAAADFKVNHEDDEWLGAVSLINSADRKVRKAGQTLRRVMEELGKTGPVGLESPAS